MDSDKKKYYLNLLNQLEPFLSNIAERSGEFWWSPPGEDWHFVCDMGYIQRFFNQLEAWLTDDSDSIEQEVPRPNFYLRHPPEN